MGNRLKMMITGSGITTPYITSMWKDIDIDTIEDRETWWYNDRRDYLDGRNKKPYHDLINGNQVFSTKIVKYTDSDPVSDSEPYWSRKCEIVGANNVNFEIGFFKTTGRWGAQTSIKFRVNQLDNGTWKKTDWRYGTYHSTTFITIRWEQADTLELDKVTVLSNLGHEDDNGDMYADVIFGLIRSTESKFRKYIGWFFMPQKYRSAITPWYQDGKYYVMKYGYNFMSANKNPSDLQLVLDYIQGAVIPDFPYTDTDTAGGDGNQDNTSDEITIPDAPGDVDAQVRGQGMVGVYEITKSASVLLCDFLYNNNVFNTMVKKLYNNPVDAIMDYFYIPIKPKINTSGHIGLCGMDTGISANIVSSMYTTFDFGTLNIEEYYGNFLDYEPYTKLSIYLPFIGIREINANLYMNGSLHILYRVDVMTGCFVCYLEVTQNTQWGIRKQMVNSFSGSMAIHLPLTNISNTMMTQSFITGISGVASGATQIALGNPTGIVKAGTGLASMAGSSYMGGTSLETVSRYDGNIGFLGVMYPYLIIERPVANIPMQYGKYAGYTSFIDRKLADMKGYTQVFEIHLDGTSGMTDEEKTEMEKILKEGIYI